MYDNLSDKRAYSNTLGCLMLNTMLIDDIDRPLDRTDFNTEAFYELLYVAIYNLYMNGCETIDEFAIDSYLKDYKKQYAIFQENNGLEYVNNAKAIADLGNYDYYYHRLRKYALLRFYEKNGLDTRFIYDPTTVDKELDAENIKFDNYTEQDIVESVESKFVIEPNMKWCTNTLSTDVQASSGLAELVEEYMRIPDVGLPLNNDGLNTITRGARLGCLYMRSLIQGQGKTRLAAADACKMAIPYVYDLDKKEYVYTGLSEPTLYITTEMPCDEIQTIFLAAVSKVNEEHILYGEYIGDELERVKKAIELMKSSPLYIVHIPDFCIEDIKNIIKKYNREYNVQYFFFDYIMSSLRLMSEVSNKSRMGLKEHQLLLIFSTELKTIAQQLNVFIFTASQLNGEASNAVYKDQNLLSGAKALANKLDVGLISMKPSAADLRKLEPIMRNMVGMAEPNMGHWIYKVRRGKLTRIIIWSRVDLGTMTEKALFVTDYDFEVIDIDFTKIESVEAKIREHSIAESQVKDSPVNTETDDELETETIEELPFEEDKPNKHSVKAKKTESDKKYNFGW